jgi:hypothetical protein
MKEIFNHSFVFLHSLYYGWTNHDVNNNINFYEQNNFTMDWTPCLALDRGAYSKQEISFLRSTLSQSIYIPSKIFPLLH